jgi:prophage antirepressor-like protein
MQLTLEGHIAKVAYFKEDDIWFEAKPLVLYLEYSATNISHTLGIVKDKNKKTLNDLLETRGRPKTGDWSDRSPSHNDLKSLYINEPGLYSLIFRSTKRQAQHFQDWVYEEVLTALRRHGSYAGKGPTDHYPLSSGRKVSANLNQQTSKTACPQAREPASLPELCLDWVKDLGVSRCEVSGVRSHFKTLVQIDIAAGEISAKSPTEAWIKSPPARFKDLAQGAVASYRYLLEQRGKATVAGSTVAHMRETGKSCHDQDSEDSSDEDSDILKISEVMHAAGVWTAVWASFRSDLANQMLSLKCAETAGSFSDRRQEMVQGHIPIFVHKYRKTSDWPLAWKALQNTRDIYEKRVRECLQQMYVLAGSPAESTGQAAAELAKAIAASLRVMPSAS